MLTVTIEDLRYVVIVRCEGRIVCGEETSLLCAAVRLYGRNVVLDLSRVDRIDASGVGALISLQAAGIYLKLAHPNQHIRDILRITGLDTIFEIDETPRTDETTEERILQSESPVLAFDPRLELPLIQTGD